MTSSNCPLEEGNRIDHKLFGFGAVVGALFPWRPRRRLDRSRQMGRPDADRRSRHASGATQSVIA